MKYIEVLKNNTDIIRKFIVNLITMSIFGIFLTIPVGAIIKQNDLSPMLSSLASLFALFFFVFVTHDAFWQVGAKNSIREKTRFGKADRWVGFKCIIAAYSPVILLTIIIIALRIANQVTQIQVFAQIYGTMVFFVNILFQGMYLGAFNTIFNQNVYFFFLFHVITVALPSLSYYFGTKEIKVRSFIGLGDVNFGDKNK